jgi:hypothetical protein
MFLSFPGYAQESIRLVRGTVKALDNQPLPSIAISTDNGDLFTLRGSGYFELRVSSICRSITFKADGHLPEKKEIDGSYLMVKLAPKPEQKVEMEPKEQEEIQIQPEKQKVKKEQDSEQKPEEKVKEEPTKPASAVKDKEQKKIAARIQSCYDEIKDLRNGIFQSESIEDLKDIYPQVGALSKKIHDYDDENLKLELNKLVELLKQKSELLYQK